MHDKASIFSSDFFSLAVLANQRENVLVSPVSFLSSLSMLLSGLRNSTELELKHILNLKGLARHVIDDYFDLLIKSCDQNAESEVRYREILQIKHLLLVSKDLNISQEYTNLVEEKYHAEIVRVDFDGHDFNVNEWIKKQTHGLIDGFFDSPPTIRTNLVLLNSLHFQAIWQTPFRLSKHRTFNSEDNQSLTVQYMRASGRFNFKSVPLKVKNRFLSPPGRLQMVELPFYNSNISMVLLFPPKFEPIESLLSYPICQTVTKFIRKPNLIKTSFEIPKFKVKTGLGKCNILREMGASDIFSPSRDFSGISEELILPLFNVAHSVTVQFDESGTSVGAITYPDMFSCATTYTRANDPESMILDRPFIFVIYDKHHQLPLLMGTYRKFVS